MINLTQHTSTAEQVADGVRDLSHVEREQLKKLLTFNDLPTLEEVQQRASSIAAMADGHDSAMIGGAPFLMAPLEAALRRRGIQAMYAFSRRESVETTDPDGSVRKTVVFRHLGFVTGE